MYRDHLTTLRPSLKMMSFLNGSKAARLNGERGARPPDIKSTQVALSALSKFCHIRSLRKHAPCAFLLKSATCSCLADWFLGADASNGFH